MALTKVTGQVIKNTTDVTVGVLTVTNTLAVGGTVSIGGTLTYEDVTNVDAVGLITARNGIVVGSGITLSKDGDGFLHRCHNINHICRCIDRKRNWKYKWRNSLLVLKEHSQEILLRS